MKRIAILIILLCAAALIAAACSLFAPREDPVVPGRVGVFPHAIHVGDDVALDCVDCHDTVEDEADAGMPTLALCRSCHDEEEDADKPLAQQVSGFVLSGDEEASFSYVTQPAVDLQFSHVAHVDAEVNCEDCHAGVSQAEETTWDWKVSMDSCLSCHQSQGLAALDCEQCHEGLSADDPPSTHGGDWQQVHGMLASLDDLHSPVPAMDCALCHTQQDCTSCHRTTQPISHTEPWRTRGHGFAASLNRESCATCHSEASCNTCHRTAVPVNHGGIFGGTTSAHCISCHLPLDESDSCSVCHKSAPSHRQAPLRLGPPHPGPNSDCRSCHTPLDHLDNGQDCTTCHH